MSLQLYAQSICDQLQNDDFEAIEEIVKKRVEMLRKDDSYSSNRERLDTLETEMNRVPCITNAYWNKNSSFTLNTLQYIHRLSIQFNTSSGIVEKCYFIQTYFAHEKRNGGNSKLLYIRSESCSGFIKKHLAIDSSNNVSRIKGRQNSICKITSALIEPARDHRYRIRIHAYEEGLPIKVKLTIQNFSDSVQKFIWPINQNCGKKIIYFELRNQDGSQKLIENRVVSLPHNEMIPYDILSLNPMEKRTFSHTINGFIQKGQKPIEAHHNLGPLTAGNYTLKVWYDPNPLNEENLPGTWKPIELDSVAFRYEPKLEIIRSRKYCWEQYALRYQDSISPIEKSQACFRISVISGGGNYYYDTGANSYDGIGVVEEVKKGYQSVGDTIAFSFRHQPANVEKTNQLNRLKESFGEQGSRQYWIYATNSFANYYQIGQPNSSDSFLKGKRNYQLINDPRSIKKHLLTKPKTN